MREKKGYINMNLLFYIIFIGPLSIAFFLYGFFPMVNYDNKISTYNDVPQFIENVRVKSDLLYQPIAKKLVIMVIDALRWDFITGSIGKVAMPVTSSLIANSSACLLKAKVQSPTVTMPRIKAMTTGTVPSFIDVALNFGSKPVSGDSVLLQARKHSHKIVFYGDETWLTLFPTIFDHYDGTTSFIVTDFTEVDNNVTRHVHNKLNSSDTWSIMILHYLGLDHIGHVHGPFSPLIKTKLKEMDNVIADIQLKIHEWNKKNNPSLFIICGDHGMKDSGGHGGSTESETTVPFITIGERCSHNHNRPVEIAQIDIASTLSGILGVPIPFSNLGTTFVDTLYELSISKKLFLLYYNAKQVFKHFQKLSDYESEYTYHKYLEAIKLHVAWLNTKDQPNDMVDDIINSYHVALKGMKEILIASMIKYDSHVIIIAILSLCHMICISMTTQHHSLPTFQKIIASILFNIIIYMAINYYWESEGISLFHSRDYITTALILCMIVVLLANCTFLANIKSSDFLMIKKSGNAGMKWIFFCGTLIHAVSFAGSSFVEEEHQTWYFYWVTFLTVLLYTSAMKFFSFMQSYRNYQQYLHAQSCIKLLLLLMVHRVLRQLNSTGDKYAHLPDIAGFLTEQESMLGMTIILITALVLLTWISFVHEETMYKQQGLIFNTLTSVCIYIRHMHNNSVLNIPFYPQSRGIYEVQTFWVLLITYLMNCAYRALLTIIYNRTNFLHITSFFVVQTWVLIAAMLHQPQNVILLPCQILVTVVIRKILKDNIAPEICAFIYIWGGNVFYFYQGNSNSLATIDVVAGYIGMQSYMPLVHGTLMVINTYSAPVLAYFLLVYNTVSQYPHEAPELVAQTSKMYMSLRLLPLTIYTIIISIQRHHLFIWSVFSPKLLYEAVYSTVICAATIIPLSLVIVQNGINNCNS